MNKEIIISPFEIVGSSLCVASDDGQKVYERIATALRDEQNVIVSFHNVTSLTSAFLNSAIGQLYGSFSVEQIRAALQVKDMVAEDLALLKRVVDTAKEYFEDPERFKKAEQATLGDMDG